MSGNCRSLLLAVHRCVLARQISNNILLHSRSASVVGTVGERCGRNVTRYHHHWTATLQNQSPYKHSSPWDICQHSLSTESGAPYKADEYPPLPDYSSNLESGKKEVYIIRAKGLPWSCTAEDVMHFFSECTIRDGLKGIHLTVNRDGKRNGEAFIELENEEDVSKAMEKHRQYLGPRYVEVFEVTNSDAEDILRKTVQLPAKDGVVRLRGLPYSCTETDVILFFSDLDIVENGVTIVSNHKGRNSGEAYVQFASQEMADEALQKDREIIGNRYIEVFPSKRSEIHSSWKRAGESPSSPFSTRRTETAAQPRTGSRHISGQSLHYVHMRGLPFQANGEDIVQFFSPIPLSKVLVEFGPDGRPSGEADVFFACHEDAVSAMTRDKAHMDERFIELFLNSASTTD